MTGAGSACAFSEMRGAADPQPGETAEKTWENSRQPRPERTFEKSGRFSHPAEKTVIDPG